MESQVQRLSSEGGELQLKEVKQVDPVPDGRLYLKDPEGKVKLLTTHENFGPAFFAEGGAFSPDMQTVYTVAVKNQSQEGIYAIDLKSLNASLILSSSEMGFELIDGLTLESAAGKLYFTALNAEEIQTRSPNPETTPLRLVEQGYALDLASSRVSSIDNKSRYRELAKPSYEILEVRGIQPRATPFEMELPTLGCRRHDSEGCVKPALSDVDNPYYGEVSVNRGYNIGWHKDADAYALDFNGYGSTEADRGAQVYPVRAGTVQKVGRQTDPDNSLYGNRVWIVHRDNYRTLYAHLNTIAVKVEDNAQVGFPIGTLGGTTKCLEGDCNSDQLSPHLHFALRLGGTGEWSSDPGSAVKPEPPEAAFNSVGPYLAWGRPLQWDDPTTELKETSAVCLPAEKFPEGDPSTEKLPRYMAFSRFTYLESTCALPKMIRDLGEERSDGVWIEHDSCVFRYKDEPLPDKYFPWPNCSGGGPVPTGDSPVN